MKERDEQEAAVEWRSKQAKVSQRMGRSVLAAEAMCSTMEKSVLTPIPDFYAILYLPWAVMETPAVSVHKALCRSALFPMSIFGLYVQLSPSYLSLECTP